MGQRAPLTEAERFRVYQARLAGQTLPEIASELHCSVGCARKWWRQGRDEGLPGLSPHVRGRPRQGILGCFEPRVAAAALELKQHHRRWGADHVLVELAQQPDLAGLKLPSRSRLASYFKAKCPDCVTSPHVRAVAAVAPPQANGVHEVWQLDCQEALPLRDGSYATVCNVRDPVGAAIIASRAFAVNTPDRGPKLNWTEVRQVLREAFSEWQTLPDSLQTDNELSLAGHPSDPYPSLLTLWLVGLGVSHTFIRPHQPTDQPQVERTHRTLDGFTEDEDSRANLVAFQASLDRERQLYLHQFPCRASDCAGRPPLLAHPELLHPRRPYRLDCELALFDLQRVDRYLAQFAFDRKVSATGQVSLGGQIYSVGRAWAGHTLKVGFDPTSRHWLFFEPTEADPPELARRPIKNLDIPTLTGLAPEEFALAPPIQLTLPCFLA